SRTAFINHWTHSSRAWNNNFTSYGLNPVSLIALLLLVNYSLDGSLLLSICQVSDGRVLPRKLNKISILPYRLQIAVSSRYRSECRLEAECGIQATEYLSSIESEQRLIARLVIH